MGSDPYKLQRQESPTIAEHRDSYHDDDVTMLLLRIHHKTEYRYTRPVAFGEHRIMLRPGDSHDQRAMTAA